MDRVQELGHGGVAGDHRVGPEIREEDSAGGFVAVVDAEEDSAGVVKLLDEAPGQGRPAVTDDEYLVGILECKALVHDDLADVGPSVVGEVAVEFPNPGFGGEDDRNFGFGAEGRISHWNRLRG
jgi:hypothetical protein